MEERAVEALMAVQYGLVTRAQAERGGLSRRQIDHRSTTGRWVRIHRGVYRHAAVPGTWESNVVAACLATGGVASHQAAAVLWDLGVVAPSRPIVTVERHRRRAPAGVVVHETTQWPLRNESARLAIPVTGVDRTLLDCAGVVETCRRFLAAGSATSGDAALETRTRCA